MNAVEARIGGWKGLQGSLDLALNFGLLAIVASPCPVGDVSLHVRPDIAFSYQAAGRLGTGMRQRMQISENVASHGRGYHRSETTLGDIAKQEVLRVRDRDALKS